MKVSQYYSSCLLTILFAGLSVAFVPSSRTSTGSTSETIISKQRLLTAQTPAVVEEKPTNTRLFGWFGSSNNNKCESDIDKDEKSPVSSIENLFKSTILALSLTCATWTSTADPNLPIQEQNPIIQTVQSASATSSADSLKIATCLFEKCQLPLAKCIANPKCLANVICINTCNGKEDEIGCQIKCGDTFENDVVGEFNKCAVSEMTCVPQKPDDNSYPIPPDDKMVSKFDTSLFNGRWYITAGQNPLFDIFPCQVHFFTETSPGKFFGKLNWRIEEPDGEFFTRDAIQQFVQDPKQPAHLINHDNEYLHYKDDWYIIDYAPDNNKDGVPPFAFVYYRGSNDAWDGYGGVVVYTRAAALPESLIPRLREAAAKVNFDWDKDFTVTDNTCPSEQTDEERLLLREKFAGKAILKTEQQLQAEATRVRGNAVNSIKAQKLLVNDELEQAEKAFVELEKKTIDFEKEIVKDVANVEKEIVKDVANVEKEIVKDVTNVEKEIVKDVTNEVQAIEKIFRK